MPKVSVIIPNYNHARFLPKRIETVLNQTFQDFEVIFLDDASTDDSIEVFERYSNDARIRAVFNKVNSGSPFKQWSKGLIEAKGDYIWIAESDDFADVHFLEKLIAVLDANPSVGLAYCQSWLVDSEDKPLFENRQWTDDLSPERWLHSYVNQGKDEIQRFLVYKNTIPNASAVLFRRDVALSAAAIDDSLRYCGDWLCWINILLRSDIAYIAESLNFWRLAHTASVRGSIESAKRIREILYLLGILQQKDAVPPQRLNKVLRKHYKQWMRSAINNRVTWSTHREVVGEFSSLLPQIQVIDLVLRPFYLLQLLRRKET